LTAYAEDEGNISGSIGYSDLSLIMDITSTGRGTRAYTWNYVYGIPAISQAYDLSNDLVYYVHAPDGTLLYSIDAGELTHRRYYHFDHNGHTMFLTDQEADITDIYLYSPFEGLVAQAGETENPFTYLGKYNVFSVEGAGLYFMHGRWYDGKSGRFLNRSPLTYLSPNGLNPYQRKQNNPMDGKTSTGKESSFLLNMLSRLAFDPNGTAQAAATGIERKNNRELEALLNSRNRFKGRISRNSERQRVRQKRANIKGAKVTGDLLSGFGAAMGFVQEFDQAKEKEGLSTSWALARAITYTGASWWGKADFTGVLAEGVVQVVRVPSILGGRCNSRTQMAYTDMIKDQFVMGMVHDLGEKAAESATLHDVLYRFFQEEGRTVRIKIGGIPLADR
jgi:RHS repeat-associated protein